MTRHATPFVTGGDLIIVEASLTGPRDTATGRFVLDTGAVYATITPELADAVGLHVSKLEILGLAVPSFPVHVFDLGHEGIDGLVGLNLLSGLNYDVRSAERRILVEKIEA